MIDTASITDLISIDLILMENTVSVKTYPGLFGKKLLSTPNSLVLAFCPPSETSSRDAW